MVSIPHGGKLVSRLAKQPERLGLEGKIKKAKHKVILDDRQRSDLELIGVGAFSPLKGFLNKGDYLSVLANMRLQDGLVWSLPITLGVSKEKAKSLKEEEEIALIDKSGKPLGLLYLEEKYLFNKEEEAELIYQTTDSKHPGVAYLLKSNFEVYLAGEVEVANLPSTKFTKYALTPAEARQLFKEKGWTSIVGFQTRNPVHRAHEYIQKCALETVDGLLLHPIVGETKKDDIPAEVRLKCYQVLLKNYYPKNRVVLSVLPAAMRYAGPKEAIFHAIVRKNYGCTHFIVGRDHAGVSSYYGSFDAHKIFAHFEESELGITPLFFDYTFYCIRCGAMASYKTCPHNPDEHVALSGSKVREMLMRGETPPIEFSRPEVAQVLIDWAKGQSKVRSGHKEESKYE